MPGVSIIIPTYNRSDYLREAVGSAMAQRPGVAEVIVVDDGSTDDTADVVKRDYPSVIYVRQKNQKQAAARETGRRAATGEFPLFLDSDDKLAAGAVDTLLAALEADPGAPLAFGAAAGFNAAGPCELYPLPVPEPGAETLALVKQNFIQTPGCVLVRRSALDRAGPWDTRVHTIEDWEMLLRLSLAGPFVRVPDTVLNYRVHGENSSANKQIAHDSFCRFALIHSSRSSPLRANPPAWKYLRRARHGAINGYLEQVRREGTKLPWSEFLPLWVEQRVVGAARWALGRG